jgi:Tfp pilus assembly protein PilF
MPGLSALAFSGDFQPAHAGIARALGIGPMSLITRTDAALFYYLAGDHESAHERLISVLAQDPEFPHARLKLVCVLVAVGDLDAAMDECDRAGEALPREPAGSLAGQPKRTAQHPGQ